MRTESGKTQPWPALRRGFTIVELLIVVVVIAILAAITIVAYNGITKQANNSAVKADLATAYKKLTLNEAQDEYMPECNSYVGYQEGYGYEVCPELRSYLDGMFGNNLNRSHFSSREGRASVVVGGDWQCGGVSGSCIYVIEIKAVGASGSVFIQNESIVEHFDGIDAPWIEYLRGQEAGYRGDIEEVDEYMQMGDSCFPDGTWSQDGSQECLDIYDDEFTADGFLSWTDARLYLLEVRADMQSDLNDILGSISEANSEYDPLRAPGCGVDYAYYPDISKWVIRSSDC